MTAVAEKAQIYAALNEVQKGVNKGLSKTHKNDRFGYTFRSIDDLFGLMNPLFSENNIVVVPSVLEQISDNIGREGKTDGYRVRLKVKYTFFHSDGSSTEATVWGEGMDTQDKATNKAFQGAYKYLMFQMFSIPIIDPANDPDQSGALVAKTAAPKPAEKKQETGSVAFIPTGVSQVNPKDKPELVAYKVAGGPFEMFLAKKEDAEFVKGAIGEKALLAFKWKDTTFEGNAVRESTDVRLADAKTPTPIALEGGAYRLEFVPDAKAKELWKGTTKRGPSTLWGFGVGDYRFSSFSLNVAAVATKGYSDGTAIGVTYKPGKNKKGFDELAILSVYIPATGLVIE